MWEPDQSCGGKLDRLFSLWYNLSLEGFITYLSYINAPKERQLAEAKAEKEKRNLRVILQECESSIHAKDAELSLLRQLLTNPTAISGGSSSSSQAPPPVLLSPKSPPLGSVVMAPPSICGSSCGSGAVPALASGRPSSCIVAGGGGSPLQPFHMPPSSPGASFGPPLRIGMTSCSPRSASSPIPTPLCPPPMSLGTVATPPHSPLSNARKKTNNNKWPEESTSLVKEGKEGKSHADVHLKEKR